MIYGPTPHGIHGIAKRVSVQEVEQLERVLIAAMRHHGDSTT